MFVIGEFETAHFSFMFIGESEEQVIEEARSAWERHCKVYSDADPSFMEEVIRDHVEEIEFIHVDKLPCSFRDREEL